MARKTEQLRTLNVSVVGLAGTEKERGQSGLGKSCLCNRFIKSLADDYHVEHISVLSQTDFSGRVINNDHFLYWGETTKQADDGVEYHFQLVEQTEFIDDASFQPFKGGKMEPYVKRCAATKLTSAEKFMYICKNQLGIEKEYEQKVMPDGKFNVDGFICVFDVSMVPSRPIERQLEYTANILANLVKSKKPIVLATTKNDEAFDGFIREAEKLVSRKEFKGSIALVETSAHENVNVDLAFLVLAQMVDKAKNRMRIVPFAEAARSRKDVLDVATEAFQRLIRAQVTDFRALWSATSKKLAPNPDYIHYCNLFGQDDAQRLFRRHVKKLKDEHLARKIKGYMDTLPEILLEFFPDLPSLEEGDWELIKEKMHGHPEFNRYFLDCPADGMSWAETDLLDSTEMRIPFDVLDTSEAEMVFRNHINSLQKEQRFLEYRHQFKSLLQETGYVTPGKTLSEVQVLFMGRECFEALSEADCHHIYDLHQRDITEKARKNFQELLLEHAHLFYQFKSIAPSGTVTQDDIREITEELQEDSRYKSLDRLDNERRLLLLQHLGFVHCPIREHCPAHPNCMDAVIERLISVKAHRPSSWNRHSQWMLGSGGGDNSQLSLVLLGVGDLAHELAGEIRALCDEDEYEMDNQVYSLDYRIIDGDVSLPQNSFRTTDFTPQGCFCVFSNAESFEYIRDSLEKTLLSNLEQEDRLPFQGLPIVIVMAAEPSLSETDYEHLKGEGLNLADNLQCPFIEVSQSSTTSSMDGGKVGAVSTDDGEHNGESPAEVQTQGERFNPHLVSSALRALVTSIQQRAGFLNVCQSSLSSGITDGSCQPDIRIILSMLCADPFSVESVLGPLLSHQCCFLSGERSLTLETFLGDSKRRVEVVVTSYHSADSFRDDLVHGFILVYSTKRKASLATLVAFSQNIPNLPIQILAVTESGGAANAFFNSELSHQLITAGNAAADRLQAHFMTLTASANPKSAIYTPFFKEVWDKKMEIEQAFQLEDASGLNDSGEGTLERPLRRTQPIPPPRHSAGPVYGRCGVGIYGQRSSRAGSNEGSGSEIYERLPTDGSLGDDGEDAVSPTYPDDRRLTPSDDSDLYSTLDRPMQRSKENGVGEHLVKPSHLKTRQKTRQAEGSRQSCPSVDTLPLAFSFSLRGPSYPCGATGGRVPANPASHIMTLQSQHPLMMATGLNPSGVNPYSTPIPHYTPSSSGSAAASNHAPSPPPFGHLGESQESSSSPKLFSRDTLRDGGPYVAGRTGHRYSSFQHHHHPAGPSYPPPPVPTSAPPSSSRFSHFQSLGPSLVQAEAALWGGENRRSGSNGGADPADKKSRADASCSRDSISTSQTGWMDDSVFLRTRNEMEDEAWGPGISGGGGPGADSYSHRAFTTGRRKMLPQQQQVQVSGHPHTSRKQQQQTYQHPGKLNPKDFANVADAIARMKLVSSGKECPTVPPPPPPRLVKGKESHRHFGSYDGDYSYTSTQDTLTSGQQTNTSKSRSRYRREKERPAVYSDSDSSDSSLDRRPNISGAGLGSGDGSSRPPRKSSTHKRPRRKRAAIPVATPRVPTLPSANSQSTTTNLPPSGMPLPLSARSRGSGDTTHAADKGIGPRDPIYSALPDDDPSMDVASPRERDLGSPLVGFISRQRNLEGSGGVGLVMEQDRAERDPSTQRRKDKAKAKDDEKQEKRRLKEEERQRREREKEKERERKRNLKMTKDGKKEKVAPTLEDVVQAEGRAIPLFLETCVKFIEAEGLDSEGIYRVPGNRAHVDMLFQKLEEDPNYDIHELDIAVNAVATALKDFFKRFPSILTQDQMSEMEEISMTPDRSCRLLALRDLLTKKLTPVSFNVLKFIFQHFVKVTENCKANSMDSKNLAICWWPTLLPFEFTDMIRFEMMRPHLEDTVQAMIDQFPFLFLGKDEIVMV
ncbi:rho GTPase-activating protein 190-like isoform X3 [Daphnia pulex]|uniref:rho GTPase-activating protein 190-like isoform X3 n=1 Tax=Daphnia pulex TaxID=6669 RepID=UPI001EE0B591|nr:rho GTPase-activating protein 190-like isoform X3 [Daphnia pulex]